MGTRWLGVRVRRVDGSPVRVPPSLDRTAIKLLPWELVHAAAFGMSVNLALLSTAQVIGLTLANGLAVLYLLIAILNGGQRTMQDFVAGTLVERFSTP